MLDRQPRTLIADADHLTRHVVAHHLLLEGFDIEECRDGREALERVAAARFDLIIVDAALPRLDGIALCRAIRQSVTNANSGIFVVAASTAESDKVLALVNGADDYVTKPLSIREFVARIGAVMRRLERGRDRSAALPVERADVRLDPAKRQVIVRGQPIACSKQEFDVLYALASSPGIVFSREELLARHWSAFATATAARRDAGHTTMGIRLVDPIISRLRRKIEAEPDAPRMILTVWGVGYKFTD